MMLLWYVKKLKVNLSMCFLLIFCFIDERARVCDLSSKQA